MEGRGIGGGARDNSANGDVDGVHALCTLFNPRDLSLSLPGESEESRETTRGITVRRKGGMRTISRMADGNEPNGPGLLDGSCHF